MPKAEIEAYATTLYRCTLCRRSFRRMGQAERHLQVGCPSDPAMRACSTCRHYRGLFGCDVSVYVVPVTNCDKWEAEADVA